jgi:hypothetical protein
MSKNILPKVYFFPEGHSDNRHLVEAHEEGIDDWWLNELSEDQRNEIRERAKQAMESNDGDVKARYMDRASKFTYDVCRVNEGLDVAPWWDTYTPPREYLDRNGAQYYDPETGAPSDPEWQSGSSERK